jgi:hypothetical protein
LEAAIGIEPMNKGFADLCLTTWLRRRIERIKGEGERIKSEQAKHFLLYPFAFLLSKAGAGDET